MEDFSSPPPPPPKKSLSVDRAAFLLLRVKKAFKKKRQQRKDKQTQLASNSATASASRASRKVPPPLLRSRTLPAIIVPGIPVVSLHTDASTAAMHFGNFNCNYNTICGSSGYTSASSTHNNNNSSKIINNNNHAAALKSLNLPKDDSSFVYRRKSSGSTPHSVSVVAAAVAASGGDTGQSTDYPGASSHHTHPPHMLGDYMQSSSDDFECQADGSVLLRIPAPHVVAARAYRLAASRKRTPPTGAAGSASSGSGDARHHPFSHHSQSLRYTSHDHGAEATGSHTSYSCSSTPVGGFGGSSSYSSGALHLPSATTSSSSSSSSSNSTALTRLAKLLHQSSATAVTKLTPHTLPANMAPHPETLPIEEAPRRLSWERRKDSSALQRSASIDSFAEIVWSDSPRPSLDIPRPAVPFSKRPSASSLFSNSSTTSAAYNTQLNINYGVGCGSGGDAGHHHHQSSGGGGSATSSGNSRRESLLSPSSTRRNKMSRIINDNVTLPSSQILYESATLRSDRLLRTKPPPPSFSSSSPPPTPPRSSLPRSPPAPQQHHNATAEYTSDTEVTLRRKPLAPASYASSSLTYWRNSAIGSPSKRHDTAAGQASGRPHSHRRCGSYEINIARIRSSKSYTADDLKDMEYLLPPPHPPSTNLSVSGSNSSSAASLTTTSSLGRGSSITKNSAAAIRHTHQGRPLSTPHPTAMSNPKNAKLYDGQKDVPLVAGDENKYDGNIQVALRGGGGGGHVNHRYTVDGGGGGGEGSLKAPPLNGTSLKGGLVGSTPHRNKMSKKQLKLAQAQLDKLTQINLHLHALFSAVEHGHLDKARTILESTDVDVNSINTDGLSALDVAVLSNNRSMTKMLLQHGASESSQYSGADTTIGCKLNALLKDAESRIHELSSAVDPSSCPAPSFTSRPSISSIIIGNTGSSVTGCTGNEIDKQIGIWERRVKGLRRMLLGWDQARPPDAPSSVTVDVIGDNSIAVQALEPFDGAIATKFKVQWSTRADFSNVVGEREVMDWTSFHGTMGAQCQIGALTQGRRYFIRSACGNVKGWGPYKMSIPSSIVPSSWRDLNKHEDRYVGRQRVLDNLFTAVRVARPPDASELSLDTTHRRNPKKKTTIKQLFSVASKFQKNLRRGIYLASIVYCEDKVLVTSEDFLPVIEIDETYPSTLHSDYHWLMKVACTWEDVKSLRTDMERNLTSAVHFRTKLLSAICQMQSALGLTDLGQLYYKPLRDSHGTIVLTCIQAVRSQKAVSILNSRWLPVNKLQKKIVALMEDFTIHDMLISSIGDQIHYHQTSMERLPPGLYLGYLKMQCSVEQIQVVVPAKTPNVLPHYKVRENSHITAEEWQVLKRSKAGAEHSGPLSLSLELESSSHMDSPSEVQKLFLYDLTAAAHMLFAAMNIRPEEALNHRLYDIEVIEHSRDISFLIICPSVEFTCAAPGQSELLLQREDLASLSIQAFEMIHLRTYQPGIIHKYARLSCILELDTALANYSHREAFSTSELQTAKERLAKLQELTANLNTVWKSVRWLMDVIAFARDKNAHSSVSMQEILECGGPRRAEADRLPGGTPLLGTHQLLQPPTTIAASSPSDSGGSTTTSAKFAKNNCARGSWPGPAADREAGQLASAEHSKSEQNLGFRAVTTPVAGPTLAPPQLLAPTLPAAASSSSSIRKNSGDSVSSQYTTRSYYSAVDSTAGSNSDLNSVFAIPPSRSADTLALSSAAEAAKQAAAGSHRKRTSSNIAQVTTPTSLAASHSSSMSVPYLARDSGASSEAGKALVTSQSSAAEPPVMVKVKAASSSNLRDGCLYLKTTLSALQTEIKTTTGAEAESALEGKAICSSSAKSLSRQSSEEDNESTASFCTEQSGATGGASLASASSTSGIIQVYTAYNTGLASGTSLKLHVTPKTSAREVINLVVKQLNMAAVLKGNNGPIYTSEMMDNFCLVAVIGARERCLRDDFKPLQLQNPWKKGRLYVRQKHELLAAIEHSNRKSHLI